MNNSNKSNNKPTETQTPIYVEKRKPTIIDNNFSKRKNNHKVVVDVLVPFIEGNLDKTLYQLDSWSESDALPCDKNLASYYYPGAESNLIFYLNFLKNETVENIVYSRVDSAIWRKCFNQVKFIYANNTWEEDMYPMGIGVQFYKYFKIGSPSDFFFWMESDVNVIKKNWQIELCRLCIETTQVRGNKTFFVMGSTFVGKIGDSKQKAVQTPLHINGNAIYWNSHLFYEHFLSHVENYPKRTTYFDYDMTLYMHDYDNWGEVKNIRQEFITYDFIQNFNYDIYDKDDILLNHPRTFFIHQSDSVSNHKQRKNKQN